MTGVVEFRRVLNWDEAEAVDPPVWWRADDGSILITCGGCGIVTGLPGWDIAADGTVTPSIWHNEPQCGWHIWARLLDWAPAQ